MRNKKIDQILLKQMQPRTHDDPVRAAQRAASRSATTEAPALVRKVGEAALEKKAEDVRIIDLRGRGSYADFLVLSSGENERQLDAIGDEIAKCMKDAGQKLVGSEGENGGKWLLLDYGDVVAHVFHAEERPHYDLEGLWADAPQTRLAAPAAAANRS